MGEMIEVVAADGHRFGAYRAGPAQSRRGLIVAQEIFGVNQYIRQCADLFAGFGFAVIAPALFDRVEPGVELRYMAADITRGRALREQMTDAQVLADVTAAAATLGCEATAMVGYCWGATIAWQVAGAGDLLRAAVGWYGAGIASLRETTPRCPVQLHFGNQDSSIPPADVQTIRVAQPQVEVNEYFGVGHGFGCEARESYDANAYDQAQERTISFLNRFMPPRG